MLAASSCVGLWLSDVSREHRDQDDAADEKIARDAAEGKMRIKRRNRLLDFEDEESDDEDEDARRRRQRMAKKRKIDGDTLEQLGTSQAAPRPSLYLTISL